MSFIHKKVLK